MSVKHGVEENDGVSWFAAVPWNTLWQSCWCVSSYWCLNQDARQGHVLWMPEVRMCLRHEPDLTGSGVDGKMTRTRPLQYWIGSAVTGRLSSIAIPRRCIWTFSVLGRQNLQGGRIRRYECHLHSYVEWVGAVQQVVASQLRTFRQIQAPVFYIEEVGLGRPMMRATWFHPIEHAEFGRSGTRWSSREPYHRCRTRYGSVAAACCDRCWSKATDRSSKARSDELPESSAKSMSDTTFSTAVSVEGYCQYADCSVGKRMSDTTFSTAVSVEWYCLYADCSVGSRFDSLRYISSCLQISRSSNFEITGRFDIWRYDLASIGSTTNPYHITWSPVGLTGDMSCTK